MHRGAQLGCENWGTNLFFPSLPPVFSSYSPSPFLPSPQIQLRSLGSVVSSPSGSGRRPAANDFSYIFGFSRTYRIQECNFVYYSQDAYDTMIPWALEPPPGKFTWGSNMLERNIFWYTVSWFSAKSLLLPLECQILRLKCTKFDFGGGSLHRFPRSSRGI